MVPDFIVYNPIAHPMGHGPNVKGTDVTNPSKLRLLALIILEASIEFYRLFSLDGKECDVRARQLETQRPDGIFAIAGAMNG